MLKQRQMLKLFNICRRQANVLTFVIVNLVTNVNLFLGA